MGFNTGKKLLLILAVLTLSMMATDSVSTAPPPAAAPPPPNPVLVYIGHEYFEANGKQWTRYKYSVFNLAEYSNEMFAAAPELGLYRDERPKDQHQVQVESGRDYGLKRKQ